MDLPNVISVYLGRVLVANCKAILSDPQRNVIALRACHGRLSSFLCTVWSSHMLHSSIPAIHEVGEFYVFLQLLKRG